MWRKYREFEQGEFVVVGCDPAYGGGDFCSAQFLSATKLDVPLVYHKNTIVTDMTRNIFPELEKIADKTGIKPVVAYERQNGGAAEMEQLAALNRANKVTLFMMPSMGRVDAPQEVRYGWDTNTATRPTMLLQLKEAIDKQLLKIYDKPTITEMFSFIEVKTSSSWKAQAEVNAHDDLVMALAISWQLYQIEKPVPLNNYSKQVDDIYSEVMNRGY